LNILYIGEDSLGSTSKHRAGALQRLGHQVFQVNPKVPIPRRRWAISLAVRTGFRFFLPLINRHVLRSVGARTFDLLWLNCSGEISPAMVKRLRRQCRHVAGYMNDDPFGGRDGRKWDLFKQALPSYDLLAVVRTPNVIEAQRSGAQRVVSIFMSCDPMVHAPIAMTPAESQQWASEVVFVGNWFPERGPFLLRLQELGVPVSIYGDEWERDPNASGLRKIWRGPPANGPDYVRAIQSAKIALGLLSKGNRDLHTTRSAEVPFMAGAVFCGERTTEHEMLYRDGQEALFWATPEQCAAACRELLKDESRRLRMAAAAREKVLRWRLTNDEILAAVLRVLKGEPSEHPLVVDYSSCAVGVPKSLVAT
jgi:hypothetical protein